MTRGRLVVMSCCCWCCDGLGGAGSSSAGAGGVVTGASGGSVVVGSDANNAGGGGLGIASGLSAMLSLVVVTVAISTGEWLLTEEKLPKSSSNTSAEPDSKVTYSGLWRVCVAISSRMEYECSSIDYFPNEEYSPDPSDSTMAIPYAVTKSAMFFFAATSLLVVAEVCYFTAHVTHPRHRLCVFVAGVVFIVSGLLMLVGMVMYISVFKAEVGSKLRPRSSFQGPPFTYRYGFSFLLYVSGFITTEVAGTYAIFLYISWHQRELVRRDSRRKNYGVGSISFFSTTSADRHPLTVRNLDRINIRLRITITQIGKSLAFIWRNINAAKVQLFPESESNFLPTGISFNYNKLNTTFTCHCSRFLDFL